MISCEGLRYHIGDFSLAELTLSIPTGAYAMLRGPTGAGKTTLLELLCGLLRPAAGRIFIGGNDVTQMTPAVRRTAYVPQDLALFPTMNVHRHLEFAMRIRGVSRKRRAARVEELATRLGIASLLQRSVRNLSGGEAQRVALGRALAAAPLALLLDEPLSALDDHTRQEMYELIEQVTRDSEITTLHVTHNSEEAERLGTQHWYLERGVLRQLPPRSASGGSRSHDNDNDNDAVSRS